MKYWKVRNETILYLNSEWNCQKSSIGSKNTTFTWDLNNIMLNDFGKLSVFSVITTGITANNPYIFRIIPNIQIETSDIFVSDYNNPIIYMYQQNTAINQPTNTNFSGITLKPQALNNITISVDDDITNKTGINNTIKFIIGIKIEEIDLEYTRMDNPYQEASGRQVHKLL